MSITIGILSKSNITRQAYCALLKHNEDFSPLPVEMPANGKLAEDLRKSEVNILLIVVDKPNTAEYNLVSQLNLSSPKVRIMILAAENNEQYILRAMKAGAKGFLNANAGIDELGEAIYTLRNGHEHFDESITPHLLGKYLDTMKGLKSTSGIDSLSTRQIEIIKMWGNDMSNKEIAEKLFISVRTVESHKNHIMQRLNLSSTIDMIKFGIKNNLIEI